MIRTILSAIILFAIIWFAVSNATAISLNVFFWNISVSAALVIFLTFLVGFVFGVLRVAPSWFRKHSQMGKGQKDLDVCQKENEKHTQRIKELELELASERQKMNTPDGEEV